MNGGSLFLDNGLPASSISTTMYALFTYINTWCLSKGYQLGHFFHPSLCFMNQLPTLHLESTNMIMMNVKLPLSCVCGDALGDRKRKKNACKFSLELKGTVALPKQLVRLLCELNRVGHNGVYNSTFTPEWLNTTHMKPYRRKKEDEEFGPNIRERNVYNQTSTNVPASSIKEEGGVKDTANTTSYSRSGRKLKVKVDNSANLVRAVGYLHTPSILNLLLAYIDVSETHHNLELDELLKKYYKVKSPVDVLNITVDADGQKKTIRQLYREQWRALRMSKGKQENDEDLYKEIETEFPSLFRPGTVYPTHNTTSNNNNNNNNTHNTNNNNTMSTTTMNTNNANITVNNNNNNNMYVKQQPSSTHPHPDTSNSDEDSSFRNSYDSSVASQTSTYEQSHSYNNNNNDRHQHNNNNNNFNNNTNTNHNQVYQQQQQQTSTSTTASSMFAAASPPPTPLPLPYTTYSGMVLSGVSTHDIIIVQKSVYIKQPYNVFELSRDQVRKFSMWGVLSHYTGSFRVKLAMHPHNHEPLCDHTEYVKDVLFQHILGTKQIWHLEDCTIANLKTYVNVHHADLLVLNFDKSLYTGILSRLRHLYRLTSCTKEELSEMEDEMENEPKRQKLEHNTLI